MREFTKARSIALVIGVAVCGITGVTACGAPEPPNDLVGTSESASTFGVPQQTVYLRVPGSPQSKAKGIDHWIVREGGPSWTGIEMPTGVVVFGQDAQDRYVTHVSFAEANTDHGMAFEVVAYDGQMILEPQAAVTASSFHSLRATYGANVGAPYGNASSDFGHQCSWLPSGRAECDYTVPLDILARNAMPDPAPGVPKTFTAEWTCPNGPRSVTVPAEARGQTLHIDCANAMNGPTPQPISCDGTLPMRVITNTLSAKAVDLLGLAGNDFKAFALQRPNDPEACQLATNKVRFLWIVMGVGCAVAPATVGGLAACLAAGYELHQEIKGMRIACRPAPPLRCTSDAQCQAAQGLNSRCSQEGQCVPRWFQDPAPKGTSIPAATAGVYTPPVWIPYPSPPGGGCYDDWDCAGAMSCRLARCS